MLSPTRASPPPRRLFSPAPQPHAAWSYANSVAVPADVRDAFDYYDANRSGFIDYLELQTALRGYGFDATMDECVELVREHDEDRDGKLSLHEFYSLLLDVSRRDAYALPTDLPGDLREAFDYYDANRSGFIDYLELQTALRGYGFDATLDESVQLVRQYDDTALGKLDLHAFAALIDDLHAQPGAHAYQPWAHAAPGTPFVPLRMPVVPRQPHPRYVGNLFEYSPAVDAYAAARPRAYRHPMRPLLPSSVRTVFEQCDAEGRGVLDASRVRESLLHLGFHVSLGEASFLVRRYGAFYPGQLEAVVNFAQFVATVEHVRGGHGGLHAPPAYGSARASPYAPYAADGMPSVDPLAWYGQRPLSPGPLSPY